jgi:hypothetical protein
VVDLLDSFYPDFVLQYPKYDKDNQPPRPQMKVAIWLIIMGCGHPSFKRRGELTDIYSVPYTNQSHYITYLKP